METHNFSQVKTITEINTLLSGLHIAQQQYYICVPGSNENTYEFKPVNGKAVTIHAGDSSLDCFVYKQQGAKYWLVWDAITGLSLGNTWSTTQAKAIANIQERINDLVKRQGILPIFKAIIFSLNRSGLSPHYEYNPGKLASARERIHVTVSNKRRSNVQRLRLQTKARTLRHKLISL